MNILDFRRQYPQYDDIPDKQLGDLLYQKYYSDMDRNKFDTQFLQSTEQSKPSLFQSIGKNTVDTLARGLGTLETGANIFSSTYGIPISGYAGLLGSIVGKGPEWQQATAETLISQPKTEKGRELTNIISWPFQQLGKLGESAATAITETTGSPELGTAIGTAIETSPLLLGLKGGKTKTLSPKEQMQVNLLEKGFPITKGTVLEKIAQNVPPGSRFFKKQRADLNEMVLESNKQFVTEELGLPSPQIRPQLKNMQTEAWGKLKEAIPKDQLVKAPNVEAWINENLANLPKSEKWLTNNLQGFINEIIETEGFVKYQKLTDLPGVLWGKNYNKLPAQWRAKLGELRQALGDDFQYLQQNTGTFAIPKVYDLFEGAMETSKLGHRVNLSSFIEKLINESTTYSAERDVGIFNPTQFKTKVEANMGRIESMLPKGSEIPGLIKNYTDKMMLTASDLSRFAKEQSTMGELASRVGKYATAGSVGTLGPLAGSNPLLATGIAVPWGFETAMAYALAHPRSWLRNFVKIPQGTGKAIAVGTVLEAPQKFDEYGLPIQ